jgi:hypothetical protein
MQQQSKASSSEEQGYHDVEQTEKAANGGTGRAAHPLSARRDAPHERHERLAQLTHAVKRVMSDVDKAPQRRYSPAEWATYLGIIGGAEVEGRNVRRAVRASGYSEPQWMLERLTKALETKLKRTRGK